MCRDDCKRGKAQASNRRPRRPNLVRGERLPESRLDACIVPVSECFAGVPYNGRYR